MKTPMKFRTLLTFLFASTLALINAFSQEIPLVYAVENTGADCTKPPLPAFAELPVIEPLTDPFEWSDRSGRSTDFADWTRRRAEIAEEIQQYEIGPKPVRPDSITATYSNGILTVTIKENGDSLILTSQVVLPAGTGPFPAIIGIGGPTGSLPGNIFTSRNIATITFNFAQIMAHTQSRGSEPINKLYPDLTYMGAYSAWSWGVSRLIDGLELVQADLPIDLKRLAISGCSYAGKMALFAGAFDERIALTISQESGGGGAAAWRVSQTILGVETLGNTSHAWFMESMFRFSGSNVAKLPHDHHELMTMIAPRALLVLGNPDYVWLADESGYVSCRAAHEVWKTFGIADRFGYSIVAGHGHCALPASQYPEVEAFVEKFLLDSVNANTNVTIHPYEFSDVNRWIAWWGGDSAAFPARDAKGTESIWLESECGIVGSDWKITATPVASNNFYTKVRSGLNGVAQAPVDSSGAIYFQFTIKNDSTYHVFARVNNLSNSDDSFWIKMDDGNFDNINDLKSNGWQWKLLNSYELNAGEHTLSIAYCEAGASLDKICISSYPYLPSLRGEDALNICVPEIISGLNDPSVEQGFSLGQNYPNPFNGKTVIPFEIPVNSMVSIKVRNMVGSVITEIAGQEYIAGKHTVEFNAENLPKGVYFYTIQADKFVASNMMIIQAN